MVNDDKPFLALTEDAVLAYGSPWAGKHGLHNNICLPLKGICVLRRGPVNQIWDSSPDPYMDFLIKQTLIPEDEALAERARILLARLIQKVPIYEMECNKEPEAALVSYQKMTGM